MRNKKALSKTDERIVQYLCDPMDTRTVVQLAEDIGVTRSCVYQRKLMDHVLIEVARRKAKMRERYEDKEISDYMMGMQWDNIKRLEELIASKNEMVALKALTLWYELTGQRDAGFHVTVKNEIPLPDRIEAAKEHWDNRLKVNGN